MYYKYWKQGIPVWQTRQERLSDMLTMLDIDTAINELNERRKQVNNAMQKW